MRPEHDIDYRRSGGAERQRGAVVGGCEGWEVMQKMTPRQKRAQQKRDDRNASMRPLLPERPSSEAIKSRAERVMAAHDAGLEKKLGLTS